MKINCNLKFEIKGSMQSKPGTAPLEANPVTHKFSTVALVPLSDDVPLSAFAYEIYHSLCAIGKLFVLQNGSSD